MAIFIFFFFFPVLLLCKELKCSLTSRPEQALRGPRVYRRVQAAEGWVVLQGGISPEGYIFFLSEEIALKMKLKK